MGLGLSLSLGMISRINGTILVDSEIGKGTEFVIRLPEDFREVSAPGSDDSSDGEMTEITDGKVVSIGKNVQADAKRNR